MNVHSMSRTIIQTVTTTSGVTVRLTIKMDNILMRAPSLPAPDSVAISLFPTLKIGMALGSARNILIGKRIIHSFSFSASSGIPLAGLILFCACKGGAWIGKTCNSCCPK